MKMFGGNKNEVKPISGNLIVKTLIENPNKRHLKYFCDTMGSLGQCNG